MNSGGSMQPSADANANMQAQLEEAVRSGTVNLAQLVLSQWLQHPAEEGGQA